MERIKKSPHYRDGRFRNLSPTEVLGSLSSRLRAIWDFTTIRDNRMPDKPIPVVPLDPVPEPDGVRVFWLGHSTVLMQFGQVNILTDPVVSDRASPFRFLGPKSFYDHRQVSPENIPEIHIMVISHDHYDHLDMTAVKRLDAKTHHYVVPLGLAGHLESWGVHPDKIHECDWWDRVEIFDITLTATPSRHFSGRGPFDRFKTLWASFVIDGCGKRIFFGSDSGYDPVFKTIGDTLGPFDLTLLECGAYSRYWPQIHMLPEQTVQVHTDLNGKHLMPIHWARFNLSLHSWTEPVERLIRKADIDGVLVITPRIGQGFFLDSDVPAERWWFL